MSSFFVQEEMSRVDRILLRNEIEKLPFARAANKILTNSTVGSQQCHAEFGQRIQNVFLLHTVCPGEISRGIVDSSQKDCSKWCDI